MARILSIPDVHGSHKWEVVKNLPVDSYDYIVFHGDYFDSWDNEWPDQGENFKNICNFIREDTEHRKLLLGNHDWAYLSESRDGFSVSGHQIAHIAEIKLLLNQNLDILDLAFECDGWVFSHAGFSDTWVKSMKDVINSIYENNDHIFDFEGPYSEWNETKFSIGFLNNIWHKLEHSYIDDNFMYSFDNLLDWHGFFNPSGDEVSQGPLWIRPESLLKNAYYKNQVVGHTELCIYNNVYLSQNDNRIICIDSPSHEVFDVIDTNIENEYLTTQEYYKFYKKTIKVINDIKSQVVYHKDAIEFIKKSLLELFPKEITDRLLRTHFNFSSKI